MKLNDPHCKFVLIAMADHADHDGGNIYPGIETIAQKTGLSERTVRRHVKALINDGYLLPDGVSKYRTRRYQLNVQTGQIVHSDRTNCPLRPDTVTHNPSVSVNEPSKGTADAAPVIVGTTQQPSIMATEIVNSTALQEKKDGVTEFFNLAVAAKTNRKIITAWRGAEHLKDVCITLCDVTGLSVTKGDSGKWLKGATALYELGATADIFKRVWDEATERDRQFLTHPAAFVERVRGAKAKPAPLTHPAPTRAFEWRQNEAGEMYRHYTDSEVQA
jgi:DNA-binding transcriptional ArsR family regulator